MINLQLQASLMSQWTRPLGRGAALDASVTGTGVAAAVGTDIANRGLCSFDVAWDLHRPPSFYTANLVVQDGDNFANFLKFGVPQMEFFVNEDVEGTNPGGGGK